MQCKVHTYKKIGVCIKISEINNNKKISLYLIYYLLLKYRGMKYYQMTLSIKITYRFIYNLQKSQ